MTSSVPGTFTNGWTPLPLLSTRVPDETRARLEARGATRITTWTLGDCRVTRYADPTVGLTLLLSRDDRLPSWDEVKWARYRLLPRERWFALVLPPPELYVDDPRNPYVFEIHEIEVG